MKFQWHASGLQMLAKCGIQFERRYLMGERLRPGMGAITGTGVDRSAMHNLQHKIDAGEAAALADCLDIARDAVRAEWANGVSEDSDYKRNGGSLAQGKAIDDAVNLAKLHYAQVAPEIDPLVVQWPWVIDDSASGAQLVGTVDIVTKTAKLVLDLKTAKRSPNESVAYDSLQLTAYALARYVIDKQPAPIPVGLDYLVKTKEPKAVSIRSERTTKDFAHLAERLRRAEEIRKSGAFQPAPLDAWWCSADWCGYHGSCRYARKPKSVSVPDAAESFRKSLVLIQQKENYDTDE